MFVRTIEIPVYYIDLVVVIHRDFNEVDRKFKLELKERWAPEDPNDSDAITHQHPINLNEIYVIFSPEYLGINAFSHELMHVIGYICSVRGITPDCENDEPLAYLQGYISEELAKIVVAYMDSTKMDLRGFLLPQ